MIDGEKSEKNHQDCDPIPRLLSASEVAEILRISTKTVNKLAREAKIGCVQVTSRERRFSEEQVRAYIEAQSKKPAEVRVDMPHARQVSSPPKKGGERSFGVSKADLRKEMSLWQ